MYVGYRRLLFVVSTLIGLAGCMSMLQIKTVSLVHSSLDFNHDAAHRVVISETDLQATIKKITALGE